MPSVPAKRLVLAASACGMLLTLGLAIGCTPDSPPTANPDPMTMVTPTPASPSPISKASSPSQPSSESSPKAPTPLPYRTPTPSPKATVMPSHQTPTVSFQTQVVPLLQNHCAACHSGPGASRIALFDAVGSARYTTIKAAISQIVYDVKRGSMPLSGRRLTQSEAQLLDTWRMEGALNN